MIDDAERESELRGGSVMNLLDVFSNQGWQDLVGALLHTIWQGALLALLIAFILRRIPAHHSDARYVLALAAQFSILLGGLLTWSILEYEDGPPHRRAESAGQVEAVAPRQVTISRVNPAVATKGDTADHIHGSPRWVCGSGYRLADWRRPDDGQDGRLGLVGKSLDPEAPRRRFAHP